MRLVGKCVLITGGGSGIGRAVAVEAAARGMRPILTGRREGLLSETLAQLPDSCGAWAYPCDITDPERRKALVAEIESREGRLDILVNNAGAITVGPLAQTKDDAIATMLAVNIAAPASLIREALPLLHKSDTPCIVNMGSVFGDIAYPDFALYSATKFALRGLSDALRRELDSQGVQVTYVAPRGTDTPSIDGQGDALNKHDMKLDSPESVARMLWNAVARGRRSAYPPTMERLFVAIQRIFPRLIDANVKG